MHESWVERTDGSSWNSNGGKPASKLEDKSWVQLCKVSIETLGKNVGVPGRTRHCSFWQGITYRTIQEDR